MDNAYCPICAESLYCDPICSTCGDVSGADRDEYRLHSKDYYIEKQIKMFGKVVKEPDIRTEEESKELAETIINVLYELLIRNNFSLTFINGKMVIVDRSINKSYSIW